MLPKPYYEDEQFGIKIYHGDCRDILPYLEPVDLVLTDPPYGIKMDEGFEGFEGFGGFGEPIARRQYPDTWDKDRPDNEIFKMVISGCRAALIFGGNFFADILPRATHWIVWDKLNTMPTFGDCELIWTNIGRKSVKKITYQYNGLIGKEATRYHPTQKPVKLLELLITNYSLGNTICDPFMGSGTTLVAAKNLGKKCIGIELSQKYCDIAIDRLRQGVLEL